MQSSIIGMRPKSRADGLTLAGGRRYGRVQCKYVFSPLTNKAEFFPGLKTLHHMEIIEHELFSLL